MLKRIAALCALVVVLGLMSVAPALAALNRSGPYNWNGNSTMDYCRLSNFHTQFHKAIVDYRHTPNAGNMPMPRVLHSCAKADVKVEYVPYGAIHSAALYIRPSRGIATIKIRNTVDGPNLPSTLRHEMGHSYGMEHTHMRVYSVMSGWHNGVDYKTSHLSSYDNSQLRQLPDTYKG